MGGGLRKVFLWAFIGAIGTGKSRGCREIAIGWKETRPNAVIWKHDLQADFLDIKGVEIYQEDTDWAERIINQCLKTGEPALVILDECYNFHPNSNASDQMKLLMGRRRKLGIDIIYCVHNPTQMLKILAEHTSKYSIYYTDALEGQFNTKIPCAGRAQAASDMINKYTLVHGEAVFPIFPYLIVDTKKKGAIPVNMPKEKVRQAVQARL